LETDGKLKKLSLIAITWPIFIETLLRMFLGNVDTFMLSHYSDNAVAAVGIANQVNGMVMLVYAVTSTGTLITISQYLGAKQRQKALDAAATALVINLIFGFIMSLVLVIFAGPLLRMLNTPEELMHYSMQYLRIVGCTSFMQSLLTTSSAIIRSFGKTKVTMFTTIGMNIMNVIGNSLFLYGIFGIPVLGVPGVAISTAVSQSTAFLVVFFIVMKRIGINLSFSSVIPFKKDLAKQIISIGLPSAGESIAYQVSQLVIASMINNMGAIAASTRVYTMNIQWFVMISGISLGQGTQIIVGRYVGAGKNDKAYTACLRSLRYSIIIALVISFLIALFGRNLVGILTDNEEIIKVASKLLWLSIILETGRVFNLVIINSLKAAGDVKFPVFMGVISTWSAAVLLSYVLGVHFNLGLIGVWIGYMTDEWTRGIFMLFRWRSRLWERKRLIQEAV
jgi:putative MATE family efflux protein